VNCPALFLSVRWEAYIFIHLIILSQFVCAIQELFHFVGVSLTISCVLLKLLLLLNYLIITILGRVSHLLNVASRISEIIILMRQVVLNFKLSLECNLVRSLELFEIQADSGTLQHSFCLNITFHDSRWPGSLGKIMNKLQFKIRNVLVTPFHHAKQKLLKHLRAHYQITVKCELTVLMIRVSGTANTTSLYLYMSDDWDL
jgi:hypothetical protein